MQVELAQRLRKLDATLAVIGTDEELLNEATAAFSVDFELPEPLIDYFMRRDPVSPKFRSTYFPHWIHRYAEGIRLVGDSA